MTGSRPVSAITRGGMPRRIPSPDPGTRFGRWEVIAELPPHGGHRVLRVRCRCGTIATRRYTQLRDALRKRGSTSCGCGWREPRWSMRRDLTGQVFGRLRVVGPAPNRRTRCGNVTTWIVTCGCTGRTIRVTTASLTRPTHPKRDCGCARLAPAVDPALVVRPAPTPAAAPSTARTNGHANGHRHAATPATPRLPVDGPLRVVAVKLGIYGDLKRRPGDVFTLETAQQFQQRWMRPAAPDAVERRQTAADVIARDGGGGRRLASWPVEPEFVDVVTADRLDPDAPASYFDTEE